VADGCTESGDATRVVFALQREAGIELPTDGELYRFDVDHPETNGMIDYFVRAMERVLGPGRVRFVHPDCGFWMLKRSVADRKMRALREGRDLYLKA